MRKATLFFMAVFGVAAAAARQLPDAPKPRPFFLPRLIISDLKVNQNGNFYVFNLAYKNVGTGALPKASDMAVKPDFRILIDDREINHGFLYVPEAAAGPGWENPAFYAGRVQLPAATSFDFSWFLGNMVTVKINENHAAGSTSDSQTYNLRNMALIGSYDLMIAGASMDWVKEVLTITIRIEGPTGNMTKFQLFENSVPFQFNGTHDVVPGQRFYTITQKLRYISSGGRTVYTPDLCLLPKHGDNNLDVRDIDHRNNEARYTFHR